MSEWIDVNRSYPDFSGDEFSLKIGMLIEFEFKDDPPSDDYKKINYFLIGHVNDSGGRFYNCTCCHLPFDGIIKRYKIVWEEDGAKGN